MPAINIPARVRFALYLVGVFGTPLVGYLFSIGVFAEAEVALFSAYIAALSALAAAKTDLSEPNSRPVRPVEPEYGEH